MDREQKIKLLEALQSGNIGAIARPLPQLWCNRFAPRDLLEQVRMIYGEPARVIRYKGAPYVLSDRMAMWHFFDKDNGQIECSGQMFTREEYDNIIADLQKEDNTWLETKTLTRAIHWVRQEGNEPLESDWDWSKPDDPKKESVRQDDTENLTEQSEKKQEPQFRGPMYPAVPEGFEKWKPVSDPLIFIKPN